MTLLLALGVAASGVALGDPSKWLSLAAESMRPQPRHLWRPAAKKSQRLALPTLVVPGQPHEATLSHSLAISEPSALQVFKQASVRLNEQNGSYEDPAAAASAQREKKNESQWDEAQPSSNATINSSSPAQNDSDAAGDEEVLPEDNARASAVAAAVSITGMSVSGQQSTNATELASHKSAMVLKTENKTDKRVKQQVVHEAQAADGLDEIGDKSIDTAAKAVNGTSEDAVNVTIGEVVNHTATSALDARMTDSVTTTSMAANSTTSDNATSIHGAVNATTAQAVNATTAKAVNVTTAEALNVTTAEGVHITTATAVGALNVTAAAKADNIEKTELSTVGDAASTPGRTSVAEKVAEAMRAENSVLETAKRAEQVANRVERAAREASAAARAVSNAAQVAARTAAEAHAAMAAQSAVRAERTHTAAGADATWLESMAELKNGTETNATRKANATREVSGEDVAKSTADINDSGGATIASETTVGAVANVTTKANAMAAAKAGIVINVTARANATTLTDVMPEAEWEEEAASERGSLGGQQSNESSLSLNRSQGLRGGRDSSADNDPNRDDDPFEMDNDSTVQEWSDNNQAGSKIDDESKEAEPGAEQEFARGNVSNGLTARFLYAEGHEPELHAPETHLFARDTSNAATAVHLSAEGQQPLQQQPPPQQQGQAQALQGGEDEQLTQHLGESYDTSGQTRQELEQQSAIMSEGLRLEGATPEAQRATEPTAKAAQGTQAEQAAAKAAGGDAKQAWAAQAQAATQAQSAAAQEQAESKGRAGQTEGASPLQQWSGQSQQATAEVPNQQSIAPQQPSRTDPSVPLGRGTWEEEVARSEALRGLASAVASKHPGVELDAGQIKVLTSRPLTLDGQNAAEGAQASGLKSKQENDAPPPRPEHDMIKDPGPRGSVLPNAAPAPEMQHFKESVAPPPSLDHPAGSRVPKNWDGTHKSPLVDHATMQEPRLREEIDDDRVQPPPESHFETVSVQPSLDFTPSTTEST